MGKDKELIGRGGDDTVDASGGRCIGGRWARRGARHRKAAVSALAPTVAHFSLTRRLRRWRRRKRATAAAVRITTATVERRGVRRRGEGGCLPNLLGDGTVENS